jgi:hypothetical protein
MDKNNDKHNNRKKKESEDILGMIRKRQEEKDEGYYANQQSKLRDFLNNLDKDTCEQDYSETPIYKLGHEDGYSDGYDKGYGDAHFELFKILKAIETIIEPHIKQEC